MLPSYVKSNIEGGGDNENSQILVFNVLNCMNLGSNNLGIFWESNWSIKKCYSNEILQVNQGGFGSCPEFCLVFSHNVHA